jgi:hypothetical protein
MGNAVRSLAALANTDDRQVTSPKKPEDTEGDQAMLKMPILQSPPIADGVS